MILTKLQIEELMEVIEGFHLLFVAEHVGTSVLTKKDKATLKGFGVDWKDVPVGETKFDHAFKYGILAEVLGHETAKVMSYAGLKKFLASGKFTPLTASEKASLEYVKTRAYHDIKGLGNKILGDFSHIALEQNQIHNLILDEAAEAIKKRKTVKELASALGNKTKDWATDFNKIADYVLHLAFENGKVAQILRVKGGNADVWFDVYAGACINCKRLYLKANGEPKIFKLSQILANGSNIGRKVMAWLATVPPIHPYCRCSMNHKKDDMEWDENTKSFTKPIRDDKGVVRTSQPIITIQ